MIFVVFMLAFIALPFVIAILRLFKGVASPITMGPYQHIEQMLTAIIAQAQQQEYLRNQLQQQQLAAMFMQLANTVRHVPEPQVRTHYRNRLQEVMHDARFDEETQTFIGVDANRG